MPGDRGLVRGDYHYVVSNRGPRIRDPAYGLPRTHIPRTRVNKGDIGKDRSFWTTPALLCSPANAIVHYPEQSSS